MRPKAFLIPNPYKLYAVEFMRRLKARGFVPLAICTDPRRRHFTEHRYAEVALLAPDTRFDVFPGRLPRLAAKLKAKYDVTGLVPFNESSLDEVPQLLELFGIDWNPPDLVRRFRDKHALKLHLAKARPGLRLNLGRLVRGPEDLEGELPGRFVLKPNDGFGSAGVGVFSSREPARAHLAAHRGRTFLLEEFIEGPIYTVCGLTDETGKATVVAISVSARCSANGSDVVYDGGWLTHRREPVFAPLEAYAVEVLTASGLRRCPFHLEVIVDGRGPCLIDAAARLIGCQMAPLWSRAHGRRFDFIGAAAHGYVSKEPYGDLGLDWDHYDSIQLLTVEGISARRGTIRHIRGLKDVERLPEFSQWLIKPFVGGTVSPTVDLATVPYSFAMIGRGSLEDLRAAGERARAMLALELDGRPWTALKLALKGAWRGLRLGAGWLWKAAAASAGIR